MKGEIWTIVSDESIVSKEKCSLCLENLSSSSLFGHFKVCKGHYFHFKCDENMQIFDYVHQTGVCPVCKKKYIDGVLGSCPNGEMLVRKIPTRLTGYEECLEKTMKIFYFLKKSKFGKFYSIFLLAFRQIATPIQEQDISATKDGHIFQTLQRASRY